LRNLDSTLDAVVRRCALGKDHYAVSYLEVKQSWWPNVTKDMQTEQLLCWSGMTDTEHSATSGSNEVVVQ